MDQEKTLRRMPPMRYVREVAERPTVDYVVSVYLRDAAKIVGAIASIDGVVSTEIVTPEER